jgi:hypothetical protein
MNLLRKRKFDKLYEVKELLESKGYKVKVTESMFLLKIEAPQSITETIHYFPTTQSVVHPKENITTLVMTPTELLDYLRGREIDEHYSYYNKQYLEERYGKNKHKVSSANNKLLQRNLQQVKELETEGWLFKQEGNLLTFEYHGKKIFLDPRTNQWYTGNQKTYYCNGIRDCLARCDRYYETYIKPKLEQKEIELEAMRNRLETLYRVS